MFSDLVEINIKTGDGGNGRLSFLHEKYKEFGGPDGGDGGNGGSVRFKVNLSWNTLYYYKTHRKLVAENGEDGKGQRQHGRNARDLTKWVPQGTVIYNAETNQVIADLSSEESEALVAKGGQGGFGNAHFTSSTRQKPGFAELGLPGVELKIRLELKLIADVGLVGLPNIGKSTLLSVVSAAKPKIANYPFTTLTPNLGVVEGFGTAGFVIADIPGLIEGASAGKGLGDEFLRHIERTRVIVHILEGTSASLEKDFDLINKELGVYNPDILAKPQILAISKIDLLGSKAKKEVEKAAVKIISKYPTILDHDKKPFLFSGASKEGVRELAYEIQRKLLLIPKKRDGEIQKVFTLADVEKNFFTVTNEEDKFRVSGNKIERFAQKTDFSNAYGVARLYDIMKKMGIIKLLEKKGAVIGEKVCILDEEIDFRG